MKYRLAIAGKLDNLPPKSDIDLTITGQRTARDAIGSMGQ
jgi:hypothetical protein